MAGGGGGGGGGLRGLRLAVQCAYLRAAHLPEDIWGLSGNMLFTWEDKVKGAHCRMTEGG